MAESEELAKLIKNWKDGIAHFNERRFWEAHESWERGWSALLPERRLRIQALIQAAAVFHLLGLGRTEPARRLAGRALEKLARARPDFPRIEVPGLEVALRGVASASPEAGAAVLCAQASELRAELLLSPRL